MAVPKWPDVMNNGGGWATVVNAILRYGVGALIAVAAVTFIGWYQHQALLANTAAIAQLSRAVAEIHNQMNEADRDMGYFVISQSHQLDVLVALARIACRQNAPSEAAAMACDTAGLQEASRR